MKIMPIASTHGPLVVALVYDGLCTFEFGVAWEVFSLPRPEMGQSWYRFATAAVEAGPLRAAGGLSVHPDGGPELLESADLVVIPGWRGCDSPIPDAVLGGLQRAANRGTRIATLCSGVFPLAASGLLDGKQATTHWRYAETLRDRFPAIEVTPDVLYVDNGQLLTAAGSAAAIDLCLHIVRQDFGVEAANAVARRLVVPPHRDGGQAQFIPRPVPKIAEGARLGALMDWMEANLAGDLSIDTLARRVGMSARTFQRRFEETTGRPAGLYVTEARIARAQSMLVERSELSLNDIATLAGFGSAEVLRHHFRGKLKTTPQAWRARFASRSPSPGKRSVRRQSSA